MSPVPFAFDDQAPLSGPVVQPTSGTVENVVIFVHGYGADGNDLIGLAAQWQPALPNTLFVSPNAPQKCSMNPMGFQWFPLTDLSPRELATGVVASAPIMDHFIDYMIEKTGVAANNVYLVGFSQGTMMSLHVGLRRKEALGGIVGYSGALVLAEELKTELTHTIPVLLVHGDADPVVPVFMLQAAVSGLEAAGLTPTSHVCPGLPHGIDAVGLKMGLEHLLKAMS